MLVFVHVCAVLVCFVNPCVCMCFSFEFADNTNIYILDDARPGDGD